MGAILRSGFVLCLVTLLSGLCPAANLTPDTSLVEQGRKIYSQGILISGTPLQGARSSGAVLTGAEAACTSCHRASGMGSVEGSVRVPPIGQRYLFALADDLVMANMDGRSGKSLNRSHAPYTDMTLARALRDGVNVSDRPMSDVMPHFNLGEQDLLALQAYLHQLSADYSPGVTKEVIQFATVITPGVSDERRQAFVAMLQSALTAKNSSTSPRKRYMTSAASFVTQTERRWEVQTWELTGAPETWNAQLEERYRRKPVFALLSGLSDTTWAPVDDFCQRQQVPCWFPSVTSPASGDARYGLYFSRGVALEADVLARHLHDAPEGSVMRLIQVHDSNISGQMALQSLRTSLKRDNLPETDRELGSDPKESLRSAFQAARPGDVMALWLTPNQLRLLEGLNPPEGVNVYLSGSLLGSAGHSALPLNWRKKVHLLYPYLLPEQRAANIAYLHAWLKLRNIPLIDEVMQSEIFFSLNLMTDTLQDMLDNLYRDYLVERTEDMLGKRESSKAEQENRDRRALGRSARAAVFAESVNGSSVSAAPNAVSAQRRAFAVGDSEGTTVYPRLTLGPGQRFASRGAYIVKFASGESDQLVAESEWIVP